MVKYINNNKEYGIDEFYYSNYYGEYIIIQFNKGEKYQLFNKTGGDAIKFNGIDEFYYSYYYGEYIKIQFNEGEKYKEFYYKDIVEK